MAPVAPCAVCKRERPLTFHHLIPRTLHGNKWFKARHTREELAAGIDVCRDCHSAIHAFVPSEKALGRDYNTLDKLLAHEELARYAAWAATQRPERRLRTRKPSRRR